MNNTFWTKTTNFKIFGKTIFQREEICKESDYENNCFEIIVKPEYYKSEFDIKDDKKN